MTFSETSLVKYRKQMLDISINSSPLEKMAAIVADDTAFKRIFLNGNYRIPNLILLKFVPKRPIDNK